MKGTEEEKEGGDRVEWEREGRVSERGRKGEEDEEGRVVDNVNTVYVFEY